VWWNETLNLKVPWSAETGQGHSAENDGAVSLRKPNGTMATNLMTFLNVPLKWKWNKCQLCIQFVVMLKVFNKHVTGSLENMLFFPFLFGPTAQWGLASCPLDHRQWSVCQSPLDNIFHFLDQGYHYKSAATQIPCDAGLISIPHN
jgi:hypothetical protein